MDQHLPKLPAELSKYIVTKKLGRGSYSDVYQIRDEKENMTYAVKIMSKKKMKSQNIDAAALNREITTLKAFNNRHLLRCEVTAEDTENHYIVTDFCNKGTLQEFINQNKNIGRLKNITYEEALYIFSQILIGYHDLYQAGYMHRDIKPEHILINDDTFIIGDFGLAIKQEKAESKNGTPLYSAPEIFGTNWDYKYDYKVDIFSLGVLLYYMVFLKQPWTKKKEDTAKPKNQSEPMDYKELDEIMRDTSGINLFIHGFPFVSTPFVELLQGMICYYPDERFTFEDVICHEVWEETKQPNVIVNPKNTGGPKPQNSQEKVAGDRKTKETFQQIRAYYLMKRRRAAEKNFTYNQYLKEGHASGTGYERTSLDPSNLNNVASSHFQEALKFEESYNGFLLDNLEAEMLRTLNTSVNSTDPNYKFINTLAYLRLLILRKFELYNQDRYKKIEMGNNIYCIESFDEISKNDEVSEAAEIFKEQMLTWAELSRIELSSQMNRFQLHKKETRSGKYLKNVFELAQKTNVTLEAIELEIEGLTMNMLQELEFKMGKTEIEKDKELMRMIRFLYCVASKEIERQTIKWRNSFSYNAFNNDMNDPAKLAEFLKNLSE